jgi:hypothetical protein
MEMPIYGTKFEVMHDLKIFGFTLNNFAYKRAALHELKSFQKFEIPKTRVFFSILLAQTFFHPRGYYAHKFCSQQVQVWCTLKLSTK